MRPYEDSLEIQPDNTAGMNNLSILLINAHQPARAESLLVRAIRVGPVATVHYRNLLRARMRWARWIRRAPWPRRARERTQRTSTAWSCSPSCNGRWESSTAYRTTLAAIEPRMTSPETRARFESDAAKLARLHGELDKAAGFDTDAAKVWQQAGVIGTPLQLTARQAFAQAWFRGDTAGAVRRLDEALPPPHCVRCRCPKRRMAKP